MKVVAVSGLTAEVESTANGLRVTGFELTLLFVVSNAGSTPDTHLLEGACGDEG